MPETPGIYKFLKKGKIIYVGKAINLKSRLDSYFSTNLSPKTQRLVNESDKISFIRVTSELEALLLEAKLIKKYQPKYNFIAKDDKHALYIKITNDSYPQIKLVRKNDDKDSLSIFGPFPSSTKVYSVFKLLRKLFPFSDHKIGKRKCIYNQIGLCNPCPNIIEQIKEDKNKKKMLKDKYLNNIKLIKKILEGNIKNVIKLLEKEMLLLSKKEEFEEAIKAREQIESLKYITQRKNVEEGFLENPNLTEDIRSNETTSLYKILKTSFPNLKSIKRIECFDVSHISGFYPTASMVTFINASPDKSLYRRFNLRTIRNNDSLSMEEVAERRAKNLKTWGKPDIIFVDGGISQLNSFKKVFDKLKIPVFPITKGREHFDYPDRNALNLIERIRDESHRFAKKYHNLLFRKNLIRI